MASTSTESTKSTSSANTTWTSSAITTPISSANAGSTIRTVASAAELPWQLQKPFSRHEHIGYTNSASLSEESADELDNYGDGKESQNMKWCLIPAPLVSALRSVPLENFLGQGVLLRNDDGLTAMVTIAQAAWLQLGELVDLLGCLLKVIAPQAPKKDRYLGQPPKGDREEDRYREPHRTFLLKWSHRYALKYSSVLHTVWIAQEELRMGFESKEHEELVMDSMLLLEWLSAVVHPHRYQCLVLRNPFSPGHRWQRKTFQSLSSRRDTFEEIQVLVISAPSEVVDTDSQGCWRKKITGGVLLRAETGRKKSKSPIEIDSTNNHCLVLTAYALWSLFNHQLRRIPGCECTLQAGKSEFLTCEKKEENCFFWHLNTEAVCGGKDCASRVSVTFTGPYRIHFNSPCKLGLRRGQTRVSPHDEIASQIMTSRRFLRRVAVEITPSTIQFSTSLGLPHPIPVKAVAGISYSLARYEVSNQPTQNNTVSIVRSEMATILVYCEERKVHLAMDGADLVESICMQLLQEVQSTNTNTPLFEGKHDSALDRMHIWEQSTFVTRSRHTVSGVEIINHACDRLRLFMDQTQRNNGPLYWSLQGMIAGRACRGIKAPTGVKQTSWYKMAKEYPILIVAVGRIHDNLLHAEDTSIYYGRLVEESSSPLSLGAVWSQVRRLLSQEFKMHWGIFVNTGRIQTLLRQAHTVYPARLEEINQNDNVTYKCVRIIFDEQQPRDIVCQGCRDCQYCPPGVSCLHYVY